MPEQIQTPEALTIPKLNPLLRNIPQAPYLEDGAANVAKNIYNEAEETKCSVIVVQNLSTSVVVVSYNTDAANGYGHQTLSACSTQEDGLGGILEIDPNERGITRISVISAASLRLSITKFNRNQRKGLL